MNKRVYVVIGAIGFLMVAGWVSNACSASNCSRPIAVGLYNDYLGRRPFYLPAQDDGADLRAAFQEVGANYTAIPSRSRSPGKWPCLSIKTNCVIPFFVSVDYFWEREAEIGGGASKWFFCFFGHVTEISETDEFQT
jgi:hypothetical protein